MRAFSLGVALLALVACKEVPVVKQVEKAEAFAYKDDFGFLSWRTVITATDGSTCTVAAREDRLVSGGKLSCSWQLAEAVK